MSILQRQVIQSLNGLSDDNLRFLLEMPGKAKELLLDIENKILYSTASIWENTIKHMLHPEKLRMNGNILEKGCEDNGYTVLPILMHMFHIMKKNLLYRFNVLDFT